MITRSWWRERRRRYTQICLRKTSWERISQQAILCEQSKLITGRIYLLGGWGLWAGFQCSRDRSRSRWFIGWRSKRWRSTRDRCVGAKGVCYWSEVWGWGVYWIGSGSTVTYVTIQWHLFRLPWRYEPGGTPYWPDIRCTSSTDIVSCTACDASIVERKCCSRWRKWVSSKRAVHPTLRRWL